MRRSKSAFMGLIFFFTTSIPFVARGFMWFTMLESASKLARLQQLL